MPGSSKRRRTGRKSKAPSAQPGMPEPLPDETDTAYQAFLAYLRTGDPTEGKRRASDRAYVEHTGRELKDKRAPTYWYKWMSRHRWVERAREHDMRVARDSLMDLNKEVAQAAQRRQRGYTALYSADLRVIQAANLASLSEEEARSLLPWAGQAIDVAARGLRTEFAPVEGELFPQGEGGSSPGLGIGVETEGDRTRVVVSLGRQQTPERERDYVKIGKMLGLPESSSVPAEDEEG